MKRDDVEDMQLHIKKTPYSHSHPLANRKSSEKLPVRKPFSAKTSHADTADTTRVHNLMIDDINGPS